MVLRLDDARVLLFLLGLEEVAPLIILCLALIVAVPLLSRVCLLLVFFERQHILRHLLLRLDFVGLVRVEDIDGAARPLLSTLVLV